MDRVKCPECGQITEIRNLKVYSLYIERFYGSATNPLEEEDISYAEWILEALECPNCGYKLYSIDLHSIADWGGRLYPDEDSMELYRSLLAPYLAQ